MKALTGLPTQAYIQVGEATNIPLQQLLGLVQELETNVSPGYIARYRPDVSGDLDERRILEVQSRLRAYLDLAERRITILTALSQQQRLTPELRAKIEGAMDRRALEDIYLPYKPKRRCAADDAVDAGLEPLARYLWTQDEAGGSIAAEAAKLVGEKAATAQAAIEGAQHIIARWLSENAEIRRDLRKIALAESEIAVAKSPPQHRLSDKEKALAKRLESLDGLRARTAKISWRQLLTIRRGAREGLLQDRIVLPDARLLQYLTGRLVKQPDSAFAPYLGAAAKTALESYIAPTLDSEVRSALDDRCDEEAVEVFRKNLRKQLMTAPAGAVPVIGIEAGRPGGWRAAVIGADGALLDAAIIRQDEAPKAKREPRQDRPAPAAEPVSSGATAGPDSGDQATPAPKASDGADAAPVDPQPATAEQPQPETATKSTAGDPQPAASSEPPETPAPEAPAAAEPAPAPAIEAEQRAPSDQASFAVSRAGEESDDDEPQAAPEDLEVIEIPPAQDSTPEPITEPQAAAHDAETAAKAEPAEPAAGPRQLVELASEAPAQHPAAAADDPAATVAAPVPPAAAKPQADAPARVEAKKPRERQAERIQTPPADLAELIAKYDVKLIAFGNGMALRQVERFVRRAVTKSGRDVRSASVTEAGAWIYATSKAARRELPQHEPAVRSAASVARRLQDPLAELVKLDPRLLGVGQGHQEVDQKLLRGALQETVEECVHEVGVDVNAASIELLALVPGMTERVAKRIVEQRSAKGPFSSRQALSRTQGLNQRVYDQAAGFLRIHGGENPLDASGVHPSWYPKLEAILQAAGKTAAEALDDPKSLEAVDLAPFVDKRHSETLLRAMLRELQPRVRAPRGTFSPPPPSAVVEPLEQISVGLKTEGVVTNAAAFGVFVDIGAQHDGLVHISQLESQYVKDSKPTSKPGDRLTVYVTHVAEDGDRISLSMRPPREQSRQRRVSPQARQTADDRRSGGRGGPGGRRRDERASNANPVHRTFGPDDQARRKQEELIKGLSIDEKLSVLAAKFRTKVE